MRDAADARMQQRIVTFVSGACVLKFCLPNMRSTCRERGADTATPTRRPCSSPADLFGTRGSLMGFITTMMVAELRADHARTGLRAAFDMACKDSRNDAFGGIAGTVPCNRFDF